MSSNVLTVNPSLGEQKALPIDLHEINVSHNPRNPIVAITPHLVEEGYCDGEGDQAVPWTANKLMTELAMSEDPELQQEFVRLLETYDNGPKGIISLANSIRASKQAQPIMLRSYRRSIRNDGGEKTYVQRYGIIAGERRTLACAYNYVKHGSPSTVIAILHHKITVEEAYDLAVIENFHRNDPTPLEEGHIFRGYYDQLDEEGKRKHNLKDIATRLNVDYQHLRHRIGLTYLPDKDQARLNDGRLTLTKAQEQGIVHMQVALGRKPSSVLSPVPDSDTSRRRVLSLKRITAHYDESRKRAVAYREALAFAMQILNEDGKGDVSVADAESDERIAEQERAEQERAEQEAA